MKKTASLFLVLLLLLTALPVGAFAATEKAYSVALVDSRAKTQSGHDASKMFDGNALTRWEVIWKDSVKEYGEVSVTVKTHEPIVLTQYAFNMSDDAGTYWGAFPSSWTLYGGNSPDGCDAVIDTFEVEAAHIKEIARSGARLDFTVNGDGKTAYKYFRFVFDGIVDPDNSTSIFYPDRLKLGEICDFWGYDSDGLGSVFSAGYPEIVYGIGGFAMGFLTALLVFRKKKATAGLSATEESENA